MRRKFEVVGTIDQNTRVFGTTYGPFSLLVAAAFEKQFKDIKAHATTPGVAVAMEKTLPAADATCRLLETKVSVGLSAAKNCEEK